MYACVCIIYIYIYICAIIYIYIMARLWQCVLKYCHHTISAKGPAVTLSRSQSSDLRSAEHGGRSGFWIFLVECWLLVDLPL